MIEIKNLYKSFGEYKIFEDFNLTIKQGEFVIFSGVSGKGKTTLLNIIGTLEEIDSGTILVDGIDIREKKNQTMYLRKKLGFLFQNYALMDSKSVKKNFDIIRNSCRTAITYDEALNKVGLDGKLDRIVYSLSGGEQQRVALARLMLKKCDIILADEPTGSLDKNNAVKIMNILKQLHDIGKTILLVTHDEELKIYGDRIVEL